MSDDFESYSVGEWPSANWSAYNNVIADPNNNRIELDPTDASNKVLKLYGGRSGRFPFNAMTLGSCDFSNSFIFEARIYNGSEEVIGGHENRGTIRLGSGLSRQLVRFLGDGTVIGCDQSVILELYDTERWYDIKIQYNLTGNNISVHYWIDGNDLGIINIHNVNIALELSYNQFQLIAPGGTVYFDDIKVTYSPTVSSIDGDFMAIGNAGNAADTTGYGAVDYNYKIGKYEITNAQWNEFVIAAGAPTGEPNKCYDNDSFWTGADLPANSISWYEAAQFCNYLTSGDKSQGPYLFSGDNTNPDNFLGIDRETAVSTYGNVYVIPTEDEWYKAAYYKPDGSGYSLYANGLDTMPDPDNGWNYAGGTYDHPWDVITGSIEQNGTYNMMGNIWELVEKEISEDFVSRRGGFLLWLTGKKKLYCKNSLLITTIWLSTVCDCYRLIFILFFKIVLTFLFFFIK